MGKIAYVHFSGKLPRGSQGEKVVVAAVICADFEGYDVITKRVKVVDDIMHTNKWTSLLGLAEAFNFIYDMQKSMLEAGVTKVYLVTESEFIHSYIKKTPTNKYIRSYLERLYSIYSTGGPKELRIGVGLAELCFRNSAKARCDSSLVASSIKEEELAENSIKIYVFPETSTSMPITELVKVPEIDGLDEALKQI